MKTSSRTAVFNYLYWVNDVINDVSAIVLAWGTEKDNLEGDLHAWGTEKGNLEGDLHALFELMLLLDEAPINKNWAASHPMQYLLDSIQLWAEDSRVHYAGIKAITAMTREHPFNESKRGRARKRLLGQK